MVVFGNDNAVDNGLTQRLKRRVCHRPRRLADRDKVNVPGQAGRFQCSPDCAVRLHGGNRRLPDSFASVLTLMADYLLTTFCGAPFKNALTLSTVMSMIR